MIIQKFGGVAMQNEEMRMKCINHIKDGIEHFQKIVVVVSAIGRLGDPYATDSLLNLSKAFSSNKEARDLVASCGELIATSVLSAELHQSGIQNKILHGMQAGIMTTGEYGDASIQTIDTTTIHHYLQEVNCVIVPGFQGMDEKGNIKTLGRGGSDLTAVALGDALQASHVEFFKDVPGVMTEDPAIIKDGQKLDSLSFDEFLDFLNCEKPIIQKRAALYAKKTATPLYIRGITGMEKGTWITI